MFQDANGIRHLNYRSLASWHHPHRKMTAADESKLWPWQSHLHISGITGISSHYRLQQFKDVTVSRGETTAAQNSTFKLRLIKMPCVQYGGMNSCTGNYFMWSSCCEIILSHLPYNSEPTVYSCFSKKVFTINIFQLITTSYLCFTFLLSMCNTGQYSCRFLFIDTRCFSLTGNHQVYRLLWWRNLLLTIMLFCFSHVQGSIGKFPDSYCCNCLHERRREGKPSSHFRKPIASVCCVTLHWEHKLFLQQVLFRIMFCSVCDGWQNWAIYLHQIEHEAR
jgi:hypothetical protein